MNWLAVLLPLVVALVQPGHAATNQTQDEPNGQAAEMGDNVLRNHFSLGEAPNLIFQPVLYPTMEVVDFHDQKELQQRNVANQSRIILLGGTNWDSQVNSIQMHGVQIHSVGAWRQCSHISEEGPRTFSLHTSTFLKDFDDDQMAGVDLLLFGGLTPTIPAAANSFQPIVDLWKLHIQANFANRVFECTWSKVDAPNTPSPRHAHGLVKLNEHQFIVHGGCARHSIPDDDIGIVRLFFLCEDALDDVHLFDSQRMAWAELQVQQPVQLIYHLFGFLSQHRVHLHERS